MIILAFLLEAPRKVFLFDGVLLKVRGLLCAYMCVYVCACVCITSTSNNELKCATIIPNTTLVKKKTA